jgi:hypothetical protein
VRATEDGGIVTGRTAEPKVGAGQPRFAIRAFAGNGKQPPLWAAAARRTVRERRGFANCQ